MRRLLRTQVLCEPHFGKHWILENYYLYTDPGLQICNVCIDYCLSILSISKFKCLSVALKNLRNLLSSYLLYLPTMALWSFHLYFSPHNNHFLPALILCAFEDSVFSMIISQVWKSYK